MSESYKDGFIRAMKEMMALHGKDSPFFSMGPTALVQLLIDCCPPSKEAIARCRWMEENKEEAVQIVTELLTSSEEYSMLYLVSAVENEVTLGVVVLAAKNKDDLAHKIATVIPFKMDSDMIDISLLIEEVNAEEVKQCTINQWYPANEARRIGFKTFQDYIVENN